MSAVFLRPRLAAEMAKQLIEPGALDIGLRSGLFLSGLRRTGKTTFLLNDLIPALERLGALVIYVDLWTDTQTSAVKLVLEAVRNTLADLQTPASTLRQKFAKVRGVDIGAVGFKFGFKLQAIGMAGGTTLAEALTAVVDQADADVVLIIDEVQHAITSSEGNQLLYAIKAARDAINPRPGTKGHLVFIGTGSHREMVSELTTRRNLAFAGATTVPYPILDQEYVEFVLSKLAAEGRAPLPSVKTTTQAFKTMGHRPEELIRALRQLFSTANRDPDETLPIIAATLRTSAADMELRKVEDLGGLAGAVFDRIATSNKSKGVFSVEATTAYTQALGRNVRVEDIQPAVNELLAANLIMRSGHGVYSITDPFVQETWLERKSLLRDF